jgi:release factor glutamine methyltransferase
VSTYHLLRQRILHELEELLDPLEARQEVRRWLEEGLGLTRPWLATHGSEAVPGAVARQVAAWLARRKAGEPWALILGWTTFAGRRFQVRPGALVPQPESETTVRVARELGLELGVRRCVDVGTGAGNIGLTLALETDWALTLTEIDPAALAVARLNGGELGAPADYLLGDQLTPVPDPIELVVANMPFVDEALAPRLARELAFEPAVAMLAPDQGIGLSTRLLAQAWARNAWACVVEIGAGQGDHLAARAREIGWPRFDLLRDRRGEDRVIAVRR